MKKVNHKRQVHPRKNYAMVFTAWFMAVIQSKRLMALLMLDDEKGFVRCWEYLDLARIG